MAYEVFISYRRRGAGLGVAGELQSKLENRGYNVFLDVDNIGSGDFPVQIDHAIQDCNDFLLILSPGMLDRCVDEEDWVRREITLAEQYGKNIIGVSLPDFVMPEAETLPEPLRSIPEKQVFMWSHEYRNASLEKIIKNMVSTERKKKKKHRGLAILLVFIAVAAVGIYAFMSDRPEVPVEPEIIPEEVNGKAIHNTFIAFLNRGDSLLGLVSNPTDKEDFQIFVNGMNEYDQALQYLKANPDYLSDTSNLEKRYDSLMTLRNEWFDRELNATVKFLGVDQIDFARYRFENAEVLAVEENLQALEAVGQRIPD